jgi:hypothetical protein
MTSFHASVAVHSCSRALIAQTRATHHVHPFNEVLYRGNCDPLAKNKYQKTASQAAVIANKHSNPIILDWHSG